MAGYPPPYPPPPNSPYGAPSSKDWKYQRRILRDQARAQRDQYRAQIRGTRRRSVLGPVVVVLIGIVFLLIQTGHLRSDLLWSWYAHWWPLLLVVAGVVLLAEWWSDQLRARNSQQPYVRRSSGGIIALVIMLAVGGIAANATHDGGNFFSNGFSINPDNIEEFMGDKHESDESLVQAFIPGGSLTIDNPHGDVTVNGGSTDNEVHISVHKQVYSRSDSDAESKARELSPSIKSSGKLLSVSFPNRNGAVTDVTMTVPTGTNLTINANHGDVHVDSMKAPLTITANHGDVALSSVVGAVTSRINNSGSSFSAHSIVGPVSVEGHGQDMTLSDINGSVGLNGDFYGTTHLEHITGSVKFHTSRTDFQLARLDGQMEISPDADLSADRAVGPVVLTTRNRNITLERISGDLSVTNRNGSVDLTSAPPLGNVTVQNRNGSVSLTLPDNANFGVSAETSDGDMQNDFSLSTQETNSHKSVNGTIGKGGSVIRINTSQGDVAIKKASIAPLPPRPPVQPAAPAEPAVSVKGEDGSSVYVGKDGVRIMSGADGSSVIVARDGLRVTSNADGGSAYSGRDGTKLTENADGSKVYIGRDGTRYTQGADGGKVYIGRDGTRIIINADGSQIATGPGGKSLSDSVVKDYLHRGDESVRQAEQQRDAAKREHRSGNDDN